LLAETEGSRIPPQGLVPRASAQIALRLPILVPILKNARDSLYMPTPNIIRAKLSVARHLDRPLLAVTD